MIEMLIASRRMSAAALAWLREKPQGSYLKGGEDPSYSRVEAEPLISAKLVLFVSGRERELRICSLFLSTACHGETNLARWEGSHEINC